MNAHQPPAQKAVETNPVRAVLDEDLLDEVYAGLELAKSYTQSMMEAARRGDRHELSVRRRQISSSLKHAFGAHDMLVGEAK